jgi:nitroreductase
MTNPHAHDSQDLQSLLLSRRTIHDYTAQPLPEGALDAAIEAAIRAPNHKLTNPWRFTLLGPQAREALSTLAVHLKTDGAMAPPERVAKVRAQFDTPPALLVVSQIVSPDAHRAHEDYAACACAIQNLQLSLWARGVGSKWSSGAITTHADTYKLAGVSAPEQIIGFVWIVYPANIPDPPRLPAAAVFRTTA